MNGDNSFQDIDSDSDDRSIRRIPISRKPKVRRPVEGSGVVDRGNGPDRPVYTSRRKSRFGIWFVALISVVVLFFAFSLLFSGVKIKVTPKQEAVLINGEFTAFKEAQSGELQFEVMTLTREATTEIMATGEEFVEEKASGKILIYNNYSTASQKLIKDTRFETTNGLIFRIKDAVTVPGRKTVGGETVPGSLEVIVYADKTGDSYNIGLTDFTIPGLKGDPRFSKFYARSKTTMTGGLSGTIKKASDSDLASASTKLEEQVEMEILEEASSVKPEGFILLEGAYSIETDLKTSNGGDGNVLVTKTATFYGLIFDEKDFAKFVAEKTIAQYDGSEVELNGIDNLRLTIAKSEPLDILNTESITFELNGDTKVVWTFDEVSLIEDLKGKPKGDVNSILSSYPSIEGAEVVLRPFWKRTIAENDKKIKLEKIVD
jgi:hypothetical protein